MSDTLSRPLTPADADLQDFPFMPLHVARLRDSDLAAEGEPEGNWYAVLLWAASWHQVPAGSLPDNDAVLMRLVDLGRDTKTWARFRGDALRGFIKCSDGRLYHPVVAEQVVSAWRSKLEQRHRTECARIKKHNQRHGTDQIAPSYEAFVAAEFPSSVPFIGSGQLEMSLGTDGEKDGDNASKRQREGQGQGHREGYIPPKAPFRIPNGWEPGPLPDKVEALASLWPPDRLERELDAFRDYWASRSGNAAKLDWDRTWHNRIRDQHDRVMKENGNGRFGGNGGGFNRTGDGFVDAGLEAIAQRRERGGA